MDQKKLASLYRMLQRSGFDSQLIHRELRAVRSGSTADEFAEAYSAVDETER